MTTPAHVALTTAIEAYTTATEKFAEGANKAAGNRAKRALRDITKLARVRREEVHAIINPEAAAQRAEKHAAKLAAKTAADANPTTPA
jgi:hypothetical protein